MWSPKSVNLSILASSSESVQLWHIKENKQADLIWDATLLKAKYLQEGYVETGAVTSFDWSRTSPSHLIAASVNRICTMWDIEHQAITR